MSRRTDLEKKIGEVQARIEALKNTSGDGAAILMAGFQRTTLETQLKELRADYKRAAEAEERRGEEHEHAMQSFEREDAAFWFRRFFTTLGIANAAAFAALASGLLQADDPVKLAPVAGPAMDAFAWGALWAGSIPLWMWARLAINGLSEREGFPEPLQRVAKGFRLLMTQLIAISAVASVIMFCLGLFTATGAVHGLAEGKKVADARVAAESKARAHPITPSALAPKPAK